VSLERALELAERGRGVVEGTHPLVGAVLVRDGEVVGEGWYSGRGTPHAEAAALAAARRAAAEQTVPGHTETIEYEDEKGHWHTETARGSDRPQTQIKDRT